jgi:hypothetical protein
VKCLSALPGTLAKFLFALHGRGGPRGSACVPLGCDQASHTVAGDALWCALTPVVRAVLSRNTPTACDVQLPMTLVERERHV